MEYVEMEHGWTILRDIERVGRKWQWLHEAYTGLIMSEKTMSRRVNVTGVTRG